MGLIVINASIDVISLFDSFSTEKIVLDSEDSESKTKESKEYEDDEDSEQVNSNNIRLVFFQILINKINLDLYQYKLLSYSFNTISPPPEV